MIIEVEKRRKIQEMLKGRINLGHLSGSVKHPNLGFDSGHDLMVRGFEPHMGLYADSVDADSVGADSDRLPGILCLPLSLPLPFTFSLSLKINK